MHLLILCRVSVLQMLPKASMLPRLLKLLPGQQDGVLQQTPIASVHACTTTGQHCCTGQMLMVAPGDFRAGRAAGEVTGQAQDAQATLENPSNWETTRQGQGIWERVKSAVGAGSSDASKYAEDTAATAQVRLLNISGISSIQSSLLSSCLPTASECVSPCVEHRSSHLRSSAHIYLVLAPASLRQVDNLGLQGFHDSRLWQTCM